MLISKKNWVHDIFLTPLLAKTNKLDGLPTREHATYNCLCEKRGVSKSQPLTDIVWPCAFLIVIANANLIGNWTRLNSIGTSMGIIGIRGSKKIFASEFAIQNGDFDHVFHQFIDQSRAIANFETK